MSTIYQFSATDINGEEQSFEQYRGKVLLIVNTASKCGFTPQYDQLEMLWKKYQEQGLVVLGFPCDQFGHQEPGNSSEISEFCRVRFGVTFPLFAKVEVNGSDAHPLFQYLRKEAPGLLGSTQIKWNFTKFLVTRDGQVESRYAPKDKPESMEGKILELLG